MDFTDLKEKLKNNHFEVSVFDTKEEACAYLNKEIDGTSVASGGSQTLKEMGILEMLKKHNEVIERNDKEDTAVTMQKQMTTDIYLLSANAIDAEDGALLNIDGNGNRVSSSLYGHKKIYFVAGKNKVSKDFHTALSRLRNVVAPKNTVRLCKNTPCRTGGHCFDCNSDDRICNALVVYWKKIRSMDMEVVLINEELGY